LAFVPMEIVELYRFKKRLREVTRVEKTK